MIWKRARDVGLLGPGPLETHVAHALGFAAIAQRRSREGPLLDLGSGAGVPGLAVALALPERQMTLLDGRSQRSQFLSEAVAELGVSERVTVLAERAETAGRGGARHRYAGVLARGFGPPAVTAECGAPLLAAGGVLIVSEPPALPAPSPASAGASASRWSPSSLDELGLVLEETVHQPWSFAVLVARRPCPDRYPRRTGIPSKRPLF